MRGQTPIKERIRAAYESGITGYHSLMNAVFPRDIFPRAFMNPTRGGPPGCAMAFNRAIRDMGGHRDMEGGTIWIPKARQ